MPKLTFRVVGESNRILIVDYYVVLIYDDRHIEFQTMDNLQDPNSVKISWTEKLSKSIYNSLLQKNKLQFIACETPNKSCASTSSWV